MNGTLVSASNSKSPPSEEVSKFVGGLTVVIMIIILIAVLS